MLRATERSRALCLLLVLAAPTGEAAAQTSNPLPRRAYVPAEAPADWPAGDWTPVPLPEVVEFLKSESPSAGRVRPVAYLEQAQFRGALTEDFALEGTWSAVVHRPDDARPWIELGPVSPVLSELAWGDAGAVWGTDPYGRVLLLVDQPAGTLSGRWSQAGRSVVDRVEFPVRVPPAAATRCEIAVPAGWRLRSSAGLVLEPQPAERDGWLVWTIELGQHSETLWTLQKTDAAAAPVLLCDRTITYTLRPDACRIQAEFALQALDRPPVELIFVLPAEMTNPTVTYAGSTNLAARLEPNGEQQRLVVPLAGAEPGRLGTFRVAGDLPPVPDADFPLPIVTLGDGIVLRGNRRIDVDRPLTLKRLDADGLRQSAVNGDESGTDWFFEELRPDGRIVVRVGRPQTSLTALVATHIRRTDDGPQFHAVVSLQARSGSTYRTTFQLPPECDLVDVFPSANIVQSGLSRWSCSDGGDPSTLTVEFRQALQPQSPKQIELTGRWKNAPGGALHIPPFPVPLEADDWQMLLAIEPYPDGAAAANGESPRQTEGAQVPSHWAPHLQVLRLAAADPELSWFLADGISPSGEIVVPVPSGDAVAPPSEDDTAPAPTGRASTTSAEGPRPHVLSLDLDSRLSAADSGVQLHEARYGVSGPRDGTPLVFELPAPALLDAVIVDGHGHAIEVLDRKVALAPLPPDAREILVRYRTPPVSGAAWLGRRYQVPLPRWNLPVGGMRWTIGLPPGCTMAGAPLDSTVGPAAASPSRLERLFAPWLRSPHTPPFNPLSRAAWQSLISASAPPPAAEAGSDAAVVFASLEAPAELSLEVWDLRTAGIAAQLALITCLAFAAALRRWVRRRGGRILATGVAATLLAALIVPDGYAPLAGGCLLGFVAGGLLPHRWLQQRDWLAAWQYRRRAALTTVAGSTGVAALLIGFWPECGPARAQEPRPESASPGIPSAATAGTQPESGPFDVLIPYRDEEIAPVAYLDARVLPRFADWLRREHQIPPYLLRSVRYEVSDTDPALVRAVFDVVLLADAPRVPVVLPFRQIVFRSPDDCSVDGRPTQVRPAAASDAFVVEVERDPPAGENPAAQHTASVPRRVEIAVWFLMAGGGDGGYRCGVPPVIDARLHLPAAAVQRGLSLSGAHGSQHTDEQGEVDFGLGGAGWIRIDPAVTEGIARAPLRADATTLVEVHPMRLQARTRMDVSSQSNESGPPLPRRLTVLLPGRAEVRQVTTDSLREFSVWHSGTAATVLELEFSQPLAARQTIEIDYAAPLDPQGPIAVPAIPLLEGEELLSHRIGLRAAPGLSLELDRPALIPGRLQERLPDWFSEGQPEDSVWSPPDAVFSAAAPTPIPIRLALLDPARSVSVEQTVTIESRALRWEAVAQIEISGTQVFEHELRVARGVRIDALSVDQDGANRLLDWSRDGDRLVVHLREGRSGRQVLRLRGWLPLQSEGTTALPSVAFHSATTSDSELILRNTSGQAVELFAEGGAPLLPGFSAPRSSGVSGEAAVRRYAAPGPGVPASCQVASAPHEPDREAPPNGSSEQTAAHEEERSQSAEATGSRADRGMSTVAASGARPSLLETMVWNRIDGSAIGLTVAYFPAIDRRLELTLDLPGDVTLVSALDGDEPVATTAVEEDPSVACTMDGRPAGGMRRMAFLWRRGGTRQRGGLTASADLPVIREVASERHRVVVVPPIGRHYIPRGTARESAKVDRLVRSEQLLQLIGGHADPGHGPSAATVAGVARGLDAEIERLAATTWPNDRLRERSTALRSRWQSMRGADWLTSALEAPSDGALQSEASRQIELVAGAIADPDAALFQPAAGNRRLEFWSIDETLLRLAGGLLIGVVSLMFWLGWRRLRRRGGALATGFEVEYLGLLLLGVLWWLGLRWSALGLALIVAALVSQTAGWLRRDRAPAPARL